MTRFYESFYFKRLFGFGNPRKVPSSSQQMFSKWPPAKWKRKLCQNDLDLQAQSVLTDIYRFTPWDDIFSSSTQWLKDQAQSVSGAKPLGHRLNRVGWSIHFLFGQTEGSIRSQSQQPHWQQAPACCPASKQSNPNQTFAIGFFRLWDLLERSPHSYRFFFFAMATTSIATLHRIAIYATLR